MLLFAFTGTGILTLFGISLSDFKIAGGLLLLVIALRIINDAHYGVTAGGRPGSFLSPYRSSSGRVRSPPPSSSSARAASG